MLLKEALNSWFITLMERSSWSSQQLVSKYECLGNSFGGPVVRTLIPLQGTTGLIPGQGTKMLHVTQSGQKKKGVTIGKTLSKGEGYTGSVLFLTTSCKSIIISKLKL